MLADWIADPANPLTARVMVNRVWQYHFGRGIVRSSSNFGYQGSPPTHPELLDWLASEFVAHGWSLKQLHRLILTSSTFRMSGQVQSVGRGQGPGERSALALRPAAADGRGNPRLDPGGQRQPEPEKDGGPSIYPVIPEGSAGRPVAARRRLGPIDAGGAAARSVFVFVKRSLAVPLLAVFDAPDPDAPCPVRFTTTQPTQALGMLNSDFVNQQAKLFADAVTKEAGGDRDGAGATASCGE